MGESDQKSKKLKMLCNIRVSPASSGTSKMNSIPNIMRRGSLKPSPRISSLLSKRRTSTPSLKTVPELNKKSPRVTFEDKNKKKIKSKPKAKTTIPVGMIERRHSTVLGLDDTKALNERRLKQLMDEHVTVDKFEKVENDHFWFLLGWTHYHNNDCQMYKMINSDLLVTTMAAYIKSLVMQFLPEASERISIDLICEDGKIFNFDELRLQCKDYRMVNIIETKKKYFISATQNRTERVLNFPIPLLPENVLIALDKINKKNVTLHLYKIFQEEKLKNQSSNENSIKRKNLIRRRQSRPEIINNRGDEKLYRRKYSTAPTLEVFQEK